MLAALPSDPDFDDPLVAVAQQSQVSSLDLRLAAFSAERLFELGDDLCIVPENIGGDDAPLGVRARAEQFAHFDSLVDPSLIAAEHWKLAECEVLVWLPTA